MTTFTRIDALMAHTLGLTRNEWRVARALWVNRAISIDDLVAEFSSDPFDDKTKVVRSCVAKVNAKSALTKLPHIDSIRFYGYCVTDDFISQLDKLHKRLSK